MNWRHILCRLALAVLCGCALGYGIAAMAAEALPLTDEPQVEARLQHLAGELRCLVCQNETLAASHAELAEDLRREIRSLIRAGKSDPEILGFLVDRYGDFVRYRPPFKASTWLLWFSPFLMLLVGCLMWLRWFRPVTDEGETN